MEYCRCSDNRCIGASITIGCLYVNGYLTTTCCVVGTGATLSIESRSR